MAAKTEALRGKIAELIGSYEWGRLFRDGARVCIAGKPNVGKSRLLNALVGEERVIVTEVPGTTRDVVEESINLGGLPVALWDTAGIRRTDDQVEKISVHFTRKRIAEADAVLAVLDGSCPLSPEDRAILESLKEKKVLIAINKSDLSPRLDMRELTGLGYKETMLISAKEDFGLDHLKQELRSLLLGVEIEPQVALTNLRHKAALERAQASLNEALKTLRRSLPPEFVAVDLRDAKEGLEEVIGVISNDDILKRIFDQFCIGK